MRRGLVAGGRVTILVRKRVAGRRRVAIAAGLFGPTVVGKTARAEEGEVNDTDACAPLAPHQSRAARALER